MSEPTIRELIAKCDWPHAHITDVRYAPITVLRPNHILFFFRGEPYIAALQNRNVDVILGNSLMADVSIAFRALLDGDAVKLPSVRITNDVGTG